MVSLTGIPEALINMTRIREKRETYDEKCVFKKHY